MKAWLTTNWKPLSHTVVTIGCYVLYRYFPQLESERELLITVAVSWGVIGTAFVPSFARLPGDSGQPGQ